MTSFLRLEPYHVLVTGAAGGIGSAMVNEFSAQGCKVTGVDLKPVQSPPASDDFFAVQADISDEASIASAIAQAKERFGPIHVLCANAGIADESTEYPLWNTPTELWDKVYRVNVRGTFLTIKHFLKAAEATQVETDGEMENLAIVVTGSECGKFGQAGHTEYASGKAGLQYGLVRSVKNEIVRLNRLARINAIAPGWVNTALNGNRLDDPGEMWAEAQATVPLRKIAEPEDVARLAAFLASHRAAGHISGQCVSVDGGMEGRLLWKSTEDVAHTWKSGFYTRPDMAPSTSSPGAAPLIPRSLTPPPARITPPKPVIHVGLSADFDAVSCWLGTGAHPDNNMADYSTGFFSGEVGVPRLLRLFKKLGVEKNMTWFIPGHSMESFPKQTKMIVDSGAEIGLHGYSHEGSDQLTPEQERDVVVRCMALAEQLTGKRPVGWRAPLYRTSETTIALLEKYDFLYDSSLSHHDAVPYYIPHRPRMETVDFSQPAQTWMRAIPQPTSHSPIVEIPGNWYAEDATPLQFYPHTPNSQGYVSVSVMENIWREKFEWIMQDATERYAEAAEALEAAQTGDGAAMEEARRSFEDIKKEMLVFPLILHPDTSGMAHVIPMVERIVRWLKDRERRGEVVFMRYEDIAREWKKRQV